MALLGQAIKPKGQNTLGTPRGLKDLIQEELFERRRDLFTEVHLVFSDTISLYFEGRGGESIDKRGHYHKRDETIRGHMFCSFLALLLKQELESRIKLADLVWEWNEVIRGLIALQQVEGNFQGNRFLFRSQITAHASQAVRATGGGDTAYFAGTPVLASRPEM